METVEKVIHAMLAMQRYPWEQGVCAQALYELGREELWIPMARDAIVRSAPDGRLAMIGGDPVVSDPAAAGEVCLRAWERTGDRFFLDGAERMRDYLLNTAPRTERGIICHNLVSFDPAFSPKQLWIDGLYMVPPFLAVMGGWAETERQLRGYADALLDRRAGLFRHIWDAGQGRYLRDCFWATGNGWALMGLSRIIEAAGEKPEARSARETALELRSRVLSAMRALRTADGRFHDVLDDPESFVDGTSAMMAAAAVWRGAVNGYGADAEALSFAEQAYQTVLGKVDEWGLVREVCGCPDFNAEGTSAEAQAAFLMATAWRDRAAGKKAQKL